MASDTQLANSDFTLKIPARPVVLDGLFHVSHSERKENGILLKRVASNEQESKRTKRASGKDCPVKIP